MVRSKRIIGSIIAFMLLCATVLPVAVTATDWPMFKMNETNTGYSPDSINIDGLVWENDTGFPSKVSSPVVANGKVYVGTSFKKIHCYDKDDGTELWSFKTDAEISATPAIYDGKLYIPSGDGIFWCLNAEDGTEIWNISTGYSILYSSPTIYDDKLYQLIDDDLYCLNATDASYIWRTELGLSSGTPAIYNDSVYIGAQKGLGSKVYRINAKTGSIITQVKIGNALTSPALADGKIFIGSGSGDNHLLCLDADDLTTVWDKPFGGNVQGSPAVGYGKVYIGSWEKKLHCLDAETGDVEWEYETLAAITLSSPAIADGKVFFGSYDGFFYTLDAESGDELFKYQTKDKIQCSPAVSDGMVYIGCDKSAIYAFGHVEPQEEAELDVAIVGGFGVGVLIKNFGAVDAIDLEWDISITGGILGLINLSDDGTMETLGPEEEIVAAQLMPLGLGKIAISVTANASNAEEVLMAEEYFVFFFYVIPL
jgi:outer membrane protein assembly factor BamB